MNILVCSSGGGSNLESLILSSNVFQSYKVNKVILNRKCGAEAIAQQYGIASEVILGKRELTNALIDEAEKHDLIVLAGFMPIVSENVIAAAKGKIINTHPSLLPKHGGIGMYGVKVQESVLAAGDSIAGCTIHQVNAKVDSGKILAQSKILIPSNISAWELGGIVHQLERKLLPLTVHRIACGEVIIGI